VPAPNFYNENACLGVLNIEHIKDPTCTLWLTPQREFLLEMGRGLPSENFGGILIPITDLGTAYKLCNLLGLSTLARSIKNGGAEFEVPRAFEKWWQLQEKQS
jgi:hypothetical protein